MRTQIFRDDVMQLSREGAQRVEVLPIDEQLHVGRLRVDRSPWDGCVVVNHHNVVMGVLDNRAVAKETTLTAEQAMTPGPTTLRPHILVEEAAGPMRANGTENVLATRSNGTHIGVAQQGSTRGAGSLTRRSPFAVTCPAQAETR